VEHSVGYKSKESNVKYISYRVIAKTVESEVVTSFELAPVDGGTVPAFLPGQYLTLRLHDDVIRTYTISSAPDCRTHYRISVKRESLGRGSRHLHDRVDVGDQLEVLEPKGDFHLRLNRDARPIVLLSGGVGVTPMISMLHTLSRDDGEVVFVHACEGGSVHAFREEVDRLVDVGVRIKAYYLYRNPTDDDRQQRRFYAEGVLTKDILESLVPFNTADFYLCGPPGFMQGVYGALTALDVTPDRIFYEFFGPSTLLGPREANAGEASGLEVVFARSERRASWGSFKGSLLEFAELNGVVPDSSCRVGVCNTCQCRVNQGEVSYFDEPADMPTKGYALLCVSRPASDVLVLDL
jgi:uncharacterized protein